MGCKPDFAYLSVRTADKSSGAGRESTEAAPPEPKGRPEFFNELGLIFGATYQSISVIPDGSPEPHLSNPVTEYRPSARPGNRAPHMWFRKNGQRVSTTGLLGPFVLLLTGEDGKSWYTAAKEIAMSFGFFRAQTVAQTGDLVAEERSWPEVFGVEPNGAVLIRPDGYVMWRRQTIASDAREELSDVLNQSLCR